MYMCVRARIRCTMVLKYWTSFSSNEKKSGAINNSEKITRRYNTGLKTKREKYLMKHRCENIMANNCEYNYGKIGRKIEVRWRDMGGENGTGKEN